MSDREGLGLAEAIDALRAELVEAMRAGADADVQFPIEAMTVELGVVATKSAEGRAGFRVPLVAAEAGGVKSSGREATQTVTVTFGSPVDRDGRPVKVARTANQRKG